MEENKINQNMEEKKTINVISCGICLDDIHDNKYVLNCQHAFHTSCITEWFQTQLSSHRALSCPYCRKIHPSEVNNEHHISSFTSEQIKRLLTDGIITIYSLLNSEIFRDSLPIIHQLKNRLYRSLNRPIIRNQVEEFYNNPNYTWKKLCIIISMDMIMDKILYS